MSTAPELSQAQKAQIEGQNRATESWPSELSARQTLVRVYLEAKEKEAFEAKKAAEEARKKVGADAHLTRLTREYGWEKVAIDIVGKLKKITDTEKLGRVCRQVFETMKDEGMLVPELFDAGVLGKTEGRAAEVNDKPVFDNTPKGSQTKGIGVVEASAQTEKKARTPKPTPPVDLRVVGATMELNTYLAANPGTLKGKKKAELLRLQEAVAAAEAMALSDPAGGTAPIVETPPSLDVSDTTTVTTDLPVVNPGAPTDAELPEKPVAEVGQVSSQIAEGLKESEAHIASQVAGDVAVKPKRQTAAQKKAAQDAREAAEAQAALDAAKARDAVAGPDGPDDDEEDPFAPVPALPKPIGGKAPSSVRL